MIRIVLPEAEARVLEEQFRSTQDRKLRDRLQIVLMAQRGRQRQDIASDLGINRRSVSRWLNAYLERGLAGLVPAKAKGKTPGIPASMADEIKRWVIDGRPSRGSIAPTGPTRNWPSTWRTRTASRPPAPPCSASAPGSASACTGPPTATCAATRSSRRRPGRISPA